MGRKLRCISHPGSLLPRLSSGRLSTCSPDRYAVAVSPATQMMRKGGQGVRVHGVPPVSACVLQAIPTRVAWVQCVDLPNRVSRAHQKKIPHTTHSCRMRVVG
jgi:hypothetical protein